MGIEGYDPSLDPRFVPDDRTHILERELEHTEGDIEILSESEKRLRAIWDLTETPGWAYLTAIVQANADEVDQKMMRTTDVKEWALLRGERLAYDFFLGTPEAVMRDIRRIGRKMEELNDKANRTRERIEGV